MFHVKHIGPHILLINPWITDFAAYNFWIKPLGLLRIASLLRMNGFRITLIDCTDYPAKTK
ncbi:MAG TPA: B12-binding domain-containing radical SAM protein, partial [Thermodesulfobacteriota bacterium]|nr:B12-binding domain-containing radical SAM protein [Thermodesulfobacteriota bacterium]